jgi:hypothetical protein
VVEVVGGSHKLVMEGIVDVGFGYAVEVVKVDWCCIDGVAVRMEALVYVPTIEGSRRCIGSP